MTAKIQVVFYSMYGHVYRMAEAVAEGAREVGATEVSLWQVSELVPDEILEKSGAKAARGLCPCADGKTGAINGRRRHHLRDPDPLW